MPLDAATETYSASLAPMSVARRPFRMGTLAIYRESGGTFDILSPNECDGAVEILLPPPISSPAAHLSPTYPSMPLPPRRVLSTSEAAEYVGVSVATFREEVQAGIWRAPTRRGRSGRSVTWDVRALDMAADLMAGITSPMNASAAPDNAVAAAERAAMETFENGATEINRTQYRTPAKPGR